MRARLRDSIVLPSLHKPSADADRGGRGGGGGVCVGGGRCFYGDPQAQSQSQAGLRQASSRRSKVLTSISA